LRPQQVTASHGVARQKSIHNNSVCLTNIIVVVHIAIASPYFTLRAMFSTEL
jgi:cytochrome b